VTTRTEGDEPANARRGKRRAPDALSLGKGRLESFSDGVFAVAITLLVIEIHLPPSASPASTNALQARALLEIWPQYLVYAVSFVTIGIMWINHHALLDGAVTISYRVLATNIAFLGVVSFLPFTTEVMARLGLTRPAVVYYGLTLTAVSCAFVALQRAVMAAHPGLARRFTAWNLVGATAYPVATLIAFFVPPLAVGLIAAIAVFYAHPHNIRMAHFKPPTE
jgi:uncharacterized membrane protein